MAESQRSESPHSSADDMDMSTDKKMESETSSLSNSWENLPESTRSEMKAAEVEDAGAAAGPSVEGAVDKLLERHRNEIMFELRRLKMGDRPVTGQGNKEAVANFFRRSMAEAAGAPSEEDRRPEAVVVEVQGLVERRPVSSMLQSAGFRRQLENSIRGALSRVPAPQPAQAAPQQQSLHSMVAAQAARMASRRTQAPASPSPAPVSSRRVTDASTSGPSPAQIPAAPAPPSLEAPAPAGPERAQAWLQQVPDPVADPVERRQLTVWDSIEQAHRDDIITEISELVQRQLVTETLSAPFRTTLESQMRERVQSSGTDGRRVQEFIQTIRPSEPHVRNDFADLGIMGPQDQAMAGSLSDNMDNVSVISATAAVHVNQQQNASMNRELRALRTQVDELKNMMRLSFDMQLDIQRAIRQEVAAAMAAVLSQNAAGTPVDRPATEPARATQPVNDPHCLICLDRSTDSVLYQCGHMCVCYTCGLTLKQRGAHCPVCRAPIRDIIRAYRSNIDQ